LGRLSLAVALLVPSIAGATDLPPLLTTPATKAPPQTSTAALYELRLRLPEGRGLANLLLQAGVDQNDTAVVEQLAAGHLGDGLGGCDAKVDVVRSLSGSGFRLQRVVLMTQAGQTVIERRHGQLTIASQQGASKIARLV
jgi:hypothetical protein